MKLLNCLLCGDIIALRFEPRTCLCGCSAGNYREDGLHAEFAQKSEYSDKRTARIIGMINSEVRNSVWMRIIPFETYYKWFPIKDDGENHVHRLSWEDYWKNKEDKENG